MLCSLTASAKTINFRTTSYTYKTNNGYGWSEWSKTEKSNMLLTIDFDTDLITIYSPKMQIYKVTSAQDGYYDEDGDFIVRFKFFDQDGDMGTMDLIQRVSGKSEIYIRFSNIMWVYSVIRI